MPHKIKIFPVPSSLEMKDGLKVGRKLNRNVLYVMNNIKLSSNDDHCWKCDFHQAETSQILTKSKRLARQQLLVHSLLFQNQTQILVNAFPVSLCQDSLILGGNTVACNIINHTFYSQSCSATALRQKQSLLIMCHNKDYNECSH